MLEIEPMKVPIGVRLAPTMTVEWPDENSLFDMVLANIAKIWLQKNKIIE